MDDMSDVGAASAETLWVWGRDLCPERAWELVAVMLHW
jgi:hypothetical protein